MDDGEEQKWEIVVKRRGRRLMNLESVDGLHKKLVGASHSFGNVTFNL